MAATPPDAPPNAPADAPTDAPPTRRRRFQLLAKTKEEEDAFDIVGARHVAKRTGVLGAVAHIVKGALGGGILSGHVGYMKAGIFVAIPINVIFGFYMGYCLYLLVSSAQILYRRTRVPTMSYPDVGEAALACFPNPKIARLSKFFRYSIDATICLDLFGACACYQLIIAKTIKQLVEETQITHMEGFKEGYPGLRVYLAAMIIPMILICLITSLKYLAPFSIVANIVVLVVLCVTVYYATVNNPTFSNLKPHGTFYNFLEFSGMVVFSMSCAGVVIPIENNMAQPTKFPITLFMGMGITVMGTVLVSFFGYAGYLENSEAPITVNFPLEILPKILKGLIALMIYVTHGLNFWPPFSHCFHYIKKCKCVRERPYCWELIFRAVFVIAIALLAIVFPTINGLMGFLGAFCLSNMAFIWPCLINLLVIWHRPGLGKYKWRLWRGLLLMALGFFLWFCGSIVNANELVAVFSE